MSIPLSDQVATPDFAVVVRGYDRAQVDAYFGRVLEWRTDADNRAAVAERERDQLAQEVAELRTTVMMLEEKAGLPVPQSMSAFSERIGQMMQSALEAAHDLHEQAEREAGERRETLMRQAEELVEEARQQAAAIVDGARNAERAIEGHIVDLRAARADARGQLEALHGQLGDVLAMPEPETVGSGIAGSDVRTDGGETGSAAGTETGVEEHVETGAPMPAVGAAWSATGADAPTIVQPAVSGGGRTDGRSPAKGRR